MSATEVLTIGSIIRHRGTYNAETTYYANNQVTMYNCVFQAIGNNFSGIAPVEVNTDGTIKLTNTATWKCIIDNVTLYNAALSPNDLSTRMTAAEANIKSNSDTAASFKSFIDSKGASNGIAPLNSSGIVPTEYLPSTVRDVAEFEQFVSVSNVRQQSAAVDGRIMYNLPTNTFICRVQLSVDEAAYYNSWPTRELYLDSSLTPYAGKIYIDTSTDKTYRWDGVELVEVSKSIDLGETEDTAFAGDRGVALEKKLADAAKMVALTEQEYEDLVTDGKVDENVWYAIIDEDE